MLAPGHVKRQNSPATHCWFRRRLWLWWHRGVDGCYTGCYWCRCRWWWIAFFGEHTITWYCDTNDPPPPHTHTHTHAQTNTHTHPPHTNTHTLLTTTSHHHRRRRHRLNHHHQQHLAIDVYRQYRFSASSPRPTPTHITLSYTSMPLLYPQ